MQHAVINEYLKRSYFAIDGLWFMMVENERTFDEALKLDEKVWSVLPKIQARKVKELLELQGTGLMDFLAAIEVKLEAEEYDYQVSEASANHIQIAIRVCPWYEILKKANREYLEPRIAASICSLEFRVWLKEFGESLTFSLTPRCSTEKPLCILDFRSE